VRAMQADYPGIFAGDFEPEMLDVECRRCLGLWCLLENVRAKGICHPPSWCGQFIMNIFGAACNWRDILPAGR
jgi:hypothetical protein